MGPRPDLRGEAGSLIAFALGTRLDRWAGVITLLDAAGLSLFAVTGVAVIGWALLVLSAWSTGTGLVGVWLQKWIPAMIASGLNALAVFDRIPGLVETLRTESASLAAGSSEMFERFYSEEVEPALAGVQTSWDYLLDVQGGRERRLAPFNRMAPFLAEAERERLAL